MFYGRVTALSAPPVHTNALWTQPGPGAPINHSKAEGGGPGRSQVSARQAFKLSACRLSSAVEQRFCKAKAIGSNPLAGFLVQIGCGS